MLINYCGLIVYKIIKTYKLKFNNFKTLLKTVFTESICFNYNYLIINTYSCLNMEILVSKTQVFLF